MDEQARGHPYPEYLYRAHVHGHPFPRWQDVFEGEYSDTFGSDLHLWLESDSEVQMVMPIDDLVDTFTVEDLFWQLNLHLGKTCINSRSEPEFLSPLVSLSGDFRWTTQRICSRGRETSKDQVPGLAIFKTSMINPTGVRVYRVEDMLAFFDSRLPGSSVDISSQRREWADNAKEYVCWSLVPREALIAFSPLPDLIEGFHGGEEAFLMKGFVESNHLGDIRKLSLHISLREYADRASGFVRSIITDIPSWEEAMQLCMHIKEVLLYPWTWGYRVAESKQVLEEAISLSVEEALDAVF